MMKFIYYGTDEVDHEHINGKILDGNFTNMSLIISKVIVVAIDSDNTSCHCYYIIIFYSYPYTLQEYLNIYGQAIYSSKMVYKGAYPPYNYQLSLLFFFE